MVDYIILAEFDDLQGKIIRHSYPSNIIDDILNSQKNENQKNTAVNQSSTPQKDQKQGKIQQTNQTRQQIQDRLSDYIIPFSGNDRMIDCVFFQLNRPNLSTINQNMQTLVHSKNNIFQKIISCPSRISKLEQFVGIYWNVKLFTISNLDWIIWEDISSIDINKNQDQAAQKEYLFSLQKQTFQEKQIFNNSIFGSNTKNQQFEFKILIQDIKKNQINQTIISIPLHSFLNFKIVDYMQKKEVYRVQFQAHNGQIYGMEFLNKGESTKEYNTNNQHKQSFNIQKLCEGLSYDPYRVFEDQIFQKNYKYTQIKDDVDSKMEKTLYFMSLMLRRKHAKATRKVASFGLAIGSRYKIVENYKQIILKYLNIIFDQTQEILINDQSASVSEMPLFSEGPSIKSNKDDLKFIMSSHQKKVEQQKIEQIIQEMYNVINQKQVIQMIPNNLTFLQRQVSLDLGILVNKQVALQLPDQENNEEKKGQIIFKKSLFPFVSTKNVNNLLLKEDVKICIPQVQSSDHIATSSIYKFIQKFGSKITMLIYDSLLSGKRILFSGDTKYNSVEEVQDYVFTCQQLVSPLFHGISNIQNSFVDLLTSDQLEDPVYIAGAVNPIFRTFKKYNEFFDVLIPIDKASQANEKSTNTNLIQGNGGSFETHKGAQQSYVIQNNNKEKNQEYYDYKEMAYFNLDNQFINAIVQRMREVGDVDDEDIANSFQNYTRLMLDLAMISEDSQLHKYDTKTIELVQVYEHRLNLLKRSDVYQNQLCLKQLTEIDTKNGGGNKGEISLYDGIIYPVRKIMLSSEMGNMEIFEHFEKIDLYLQDEDSVMKLLYYLPSFNQGLSIFSEGVFSKNIEISNISKRILQKIQKCDFGAFAVKQNLTLFHNLKIVEKE